MFVRPQQIFFCLKQNEKAAARALYFLSGLMLITNIQEKYFPRFFNASVKLCGCNTNTVIFH